MDWILRIEPQEISRETKLSKIYINRFMRLRDCLKSINQDINPHATRWQISFAIAGWQYYDGEKIINNFGRGTPLVLSHEHDNEHDRRGHAVAVFTEDGTKLGYVPWHLAAEVSEKLIQTNLKAVVSQVTKSAPPHNRVQIVCMET